MQACIVDGAEIPVLGFGTARLRGDVCRQAVEHALNVGYRHIDTAQMYENEAAVGEAIANVDVDRDEIFLVTKVLRENLGYDDVINSTRASRERLGTDIDLLLIHAPSARIPIEETIAAMNELQSAGTVAQIGVSNFSVGQLADAMEVSETSIVTNQVEYHPEKRRDELLEFCLEHEVLLTAYSPLAEGRLADNAVLQEIGRSYGKSAAQVALRWLVQQEMVAAIPKAATPKHRKENLDIFDFELTPSEMRRIFEIRHGVLGRLAERLGL